jgi:hypothetical protein
LVKNKIFFLVVSRRKMILIEPTKHEKSFETLIVRLLLKIPIDNRFIGKKINKY